MATIEVRTGPLAAIEQQLEMLSPRDRKLLVGLVLFFAVVFVGGYWYLLNDLLNDKASRVREAKESLVMIQALDAEHKEHSARFAAQESRLREHSKQRVQPWVEDLATKHSITGKQLNSVSSQSSEPVSDVIERTTYKVELKRVPQEALYRFLYDLETSSFPASIEQADFKVAYYKKEKLMDLTLQLTVLKLVEGA
ncbi:MAG: type II secretion system protein M [Myxococcales bacterium]|nr:type II secretion system protein M [Myxococcales bacterium]